MHVAFLISNSRRATNTELRTQLDQSVARFTEKGKELAARIQEVEGLRNQYEAALSKVTIYLLIEQTNHLGKKKIGWRCRSTTKILLSLTAICKASFIQYHENHINLFSSSVHNKS